MKTLILIAICLLTLLWITPALAQTVSIKPSQQEPLADDWKWANPNDLAYQAKCYTLTELPTPSPIARLIEKHLDADNTHNWDSLLVTCDENVALFIGPALCEPLLRGKGQLREYFMEQLSRFPYQQREPLDLLTMGATAVVVELVRGGKKGTTSVLTTYQLTDGRISSIRYEVQR